MLNFQQRNLQNKLLDLLIVFIIPIGLWCYCFRGLLSGELALRSDAVSYYNHTKFFVDNLVQGVYPFWDPNWNNGSPNEFFLRRLGSFNPIYYLIVFLVKLGLTFKVSYYIYLVVYYFIGMFGFLRLSEKVLKNQVAAYAAYLLLVFSAWGTRLFDTFILLEFVPLIWFFVFLVGFYQDQKRYQILGALLCVMILMTTYIPFYFLLIFLIFIALYVLIYQKEAKAFIGNTFAFIAKNKVFMIFVLLSLAISLKPGLDMFFSAKDGDFVMTARSQIAGEGHAFQVAKTVVMKWAVVEDLLYSWSYKDLSRFKFAVVYVPIFSFIVLLLGLGLKHTKKLRFLFLLCIGSFLILTPYGWIYPNLYDMIFFFKLFRNLHFFLWWLMIPTFILFACEQLRIILELTQNEKKQIEYNYYVTGMGAVCIILLSLQGDAIVSSYLCVALVVLFLLIHNKLKEKRFIKLLLLLSLILQPLETYGYLNVNAQEPHEVLFYEKDLTSFNYLGNKISREEEIEVERAISKKNKQREDLVSSQTHYGLKWYDSLRNNINSGVMDLYKTNKFYVYDKVQKMKNFNYHLLEKVLYYGTNEAHVLSRDPFIKTRNENKNSAKQAIRIDSASENFEVVSYDVNHVRFRTNYSYDKFVVYNDNYHSDWRVQIDGVDAEILITNGAFKGVWVPSGEHLVEFKYKDVKSRTLNYFLIILFLSVLILVIYFRRRETSKA